MIQLPDIPEGLNDGLGEFLRAIKNKIESAEELQTKAFTVQELNALTAKNHTGQVVRCTNGNEMGDCLAYCDGFVWSILERGPKITTTERPYIFEEDGTLVFRDDATYFEDIEFSMSVAKVPAVNAPTWTTFTGGLSKYTFSINDHVDLESKEIPHSYKEGSDMHGHAHVYANGVDGTDRTVKYQVEYGIANEDAVISTTTVSKQFTIPANTPDLTHLYLDFATVPGAGILIGADIAVMIKRIATDSGTDPTGDPFVSMIGIHVENNTGGSRQERVK